MCFFSSPSKPLLRLYFTIHYNSYNFKIHYSNILSNPVQWISANVTWREVNLVDLGLEDVTLKRVLNRFDRCLWLLWTLRLIFEFHKVGNSFTSWTTIRLSRMYSTVSSHLTFQGLKTLAIQTAVNWHKNRSFNEKPFARVQNRLLPKLTAKIMKTRQLTFFNIFIIRKPSGMSYSKISKFVQKCETGSKPSEVCPQDIPAHSNGINWCVWFQTSATK